MPDPIDPVSRAARARSHGRRSSDRPTEEVRAPEGSNLPVVIEQPAASTPAPEANSKPSAAFAAQLIGGGERRGLKGGPQTLYAAKSAYLDAEWRGDSDRRTAKGKITKTDI